MLLSNRFVEPLVSPALSGQATGPEGRADGGAVLGYSPSGATKCTTAARPFHRCVPSLGCAGDQARGARFDTVSFLSDYGTIDEFVGVVKAVIRDLAPHATVIDLTHEIPPHDIRAGSLALARCIQYVPSGVVLAVVDPGWARPGERSRSRSRVGPA